MASGLVGNGELSQVVANHLSLDFDSDVLLAIVDTDDATDELGENNNVAEVCFLVSVSNIGQRGRFNVRKLEKR